MAFDWAKQSDEDYGYDMDPNVPIFGGSLEDKDHGDGMYLGAGNQGTVVLEIGLNGKRAAVKNFYGPMAKKHYDNEVLKLSMLKGSGFAPEILAKNDGALAIEIEFLPHGTLQDFLHYLRLSFGRHGLMDLRVEKALQLVACVAYFHSLRIVHCDLTPENILMHPSGVRVCDFALSGERVGNRSYADPTRIVRPECDVFSLGRVLGEVFGFYDVKTPPIYEYRKTQLSQLVPENLPRTDFLPPQALLNELGELVERCQGEVENRPTAQGLLEELRDVKRRWMI